MTSSSLPPSRACLPVAHCQQQLRRALLISPAAALLGLPGQPSLAATAALSPPALLLARRWRDADEPGGYLVSEKYDGVRGYWDGQQLHLRGGQAVAAPARFLSQLPAVPLDGELWLGRGRFDELSALVRRQSSSPADWAGVAYKVFELPGADGTFAQRVAHLLRLLPPEAEGQLGPQVVAQKPVADRAALTRWRDAVVAGGGEGLVLHRADAPYLTGRQVVLAKYKPVDDAEAVVVGHEPGQGRLAGKLGALRVRNDAGQVFNVGSGLTDAQRDQPPPLGSVITYAWRGETRTGLPRFATFVRLREPGW